MTDYQTMLKIIGPFAIVILLLVSFLNISADLILGNAIQATQPAIIQQPQQQNQPPDPNNQPAGSSQPIQLGLKNYVYYFPSTDSDTLTVKKGQPVKLELLLEGSLGLKGCTKAVKMPPQLGGQLKVARPGDNTLEFTPKTEGSFKFTCGMGMSVGGINVVN